MSFVKCFHQIFSISNWLNCWLCSGFCLFSKSKNFVLGIRIHICRYKISNVSFFQHHLFKFCFLFQMNEYLFFGLLKNSYWSISSCRKNEISNMRNCKSPNIIKALLKRLNFFVSVPIKVLYSKVFWTCEEVMSVFNKFDLRNGVLVNKHRLMAISIIKSP